VLGVRTCHGVGLDAESLGELSPVRGQHRASGEVPDTLAVLGEVGHCQGVHHQRRPEARHDRAHQLHAGLRVHQARSEEDGSAPPGQLEDGVTRGRGDVPSGGLGQAQHESLGQGDREVGGQRLDGGHLQLARSGAQRCLGGEQYGTGGLPVSPDDEHAAA